MSVISYKCPNCGGPLHFDPDRQSFFCEYCSSGFDEEALKAMAQEKEAETAEEGSEAAQTEAETGELLSFNCPSCGAEIVTEATTAATVCYYCQNPVVLSGRLSEEFRPHKVLPFTIDKEEARKRFFDWVGKKRYVPKGFFAEGDVEKLNGVYYPYWMADYEISAHFEGQGQLSHTMRQGNYQVTRTKHFAVGRDAKFRFNDIIRPALSKLDRKLADGVHPFDMSQAKEFSTAYLSGFMAEKWDVNSDAVRPDVENEINHYADSMIRTDARYQMLTGTTTTQCENANYEYVLFPTWVFTYKGKNGKLFHYAMNGQTGEICGRLPISNGKLLRDCVILAAAIVAVFCIWGWFI